LNLPTRVVRQLIAVLEKQGLLHAVQQRESLGYSLAQPAEKIPLTKLIDAIESMMPRGSDAPDDRGWAMVHQLHETHRIMLKDKTLADLV
jgi:DNA-binding IscR family transcriptional regulator